MIEVANLTKKYGSNYAVKDLNFSIEKGKIYGFLGPNGAGKSTTMNILTGYIAATEGTVLINGHDILKEPLEARSSIGYLPEQPPLYMDMTVKEYLRFAAELKGIKKEERESNIRDVIAMLQLQTMENRLIKNLSKGYKQRVGFAQAILGYPEIIILDEPTVGLDPKQIIEIRALIRELGKKHTVILSSHILSEVSEICDHVMIISNGQLTASDTTENLLKKRQPMIVLHISAAAEKSVVRSILNSIEQIQESHISESQEDGILNIEVKYSSDEDLRMEIARAFTEKGCTIVEMSAEKATLEDIFLELTENENLDAVGILRNIEENDKNSELTETVDELLSDNGYDVMVEEAYGPGDEEASAMSDFADELAGGIQNLNEHSAYEVSDFQKDEEVGSESDEMREEK